MAAKNGKAVASAQVQTFLKGQISEAQKALASLETEAEKVLAKIVARSRASRKELEALLPKDLSKDLTKRATKASNVAKKRLDGLQTRVVEAVGVASQTQVREINRELTKLSKKLDAVLTTGKKATGGQGAEPRA